VTTGLLGLAVLLMGCGGPATSAEGDRLSVVATTTVLAHLVSQVAGDRAEVTSLVPAGGEVHTFDPSPSDAARLTGADLIVMNGVGLDEWLAELAADAGAGDVPLVELAEDLDGVTYLRGEQPEDGHEGEGFNPHLWLNVRYATLYVQRIAEELSRLDPAHAATYAENTARYASELTALDEAIRSRMTALPSANRRVVSFHEAFPYFADAYGLEISGVITQVPGQDPSAGEIADLIEAIRDEGVKAIFSEVQFSDDLVEAIADETGARVVSDLYNDSLGDPPVDSYIGMMEWNAERIAEALQ
jgi:ABC-type Zn uptake system ZnuABC Zn-binding protein ZnuA